jgi:hypothetical protein
VSKVGGVGDREDMMGSHSDMRRWGGRWRAEKSVRCRDSQEDGLQRCIISSESSTKYEREKTGDRRKHQTAPAGVRRQRKHRRQEMETLKLVSDASVFSSLSRLCVEDSRILLRLRLHVNDTRSRSATKQTVK